MKTICIIAYQYKCQKQKAATTTTTTPTTTTTTTTYLTINNDAMVIGCNNDAVLPSNIPYAPPIRGQGQYIDFNI